MILFQKNIKHHAGQEKNLPKNTMFLSKHGKYKIHILVAIPLKYNITQFMGYLKVKSSLMIFDRYCRSAAKFFRQCIGRETVRDKSADHFRS